MIEWHRSYDETVLDALAEWDGVDGCGWQQLHVGDIGWATRFGADLDMGWWTAAGTVVAVAMNDGPLRTAVAPTWQHDRELAAAMVAHAVTQGFAVVDAPLGPCALRPALLAAGYEADAVGPWFHFYQPLTPAHGTAKFGAVGVRAVTSEAVAVDRVAVQRASFANSTYTLDRWRAMAASPAYRPDLDLVLHLDGVPAAGVTAWSAGPGRCGLIEPLGTDSAFRGRGLGRAAVTASCAALARAGASGVSVWTPAGNTAAVALYRAGGFRAVFVHTGFRRGTA